MPLLLAHILYLNTLFFCLIPHPLHLTVTNIEFDKENNVFKISLKIFMDDFEKIIEKKYGVALNLGKENELPDAENYFNKYIFENFNIIINKKNKKNKLNFKGKKTDTQAVWLYYEYTAIKKIRSFEVYNSILCDLYKDQINLVIFCYKDIQKGIRLKYDKRSAKIELGY